MSSDTQHAIAAYKSGQVSYAGPLRIVVLLYEGAVRFTRQALARFDEPAMRGHGIGRAHRIVSELLATLDHEKGGEVARNLDELYHFVLDSLTRANSQGRAQSLEESIDVLERLLAGWRELELRGPTEPRAA